MTHACTIDCWEDGCEVHEVCTLDVCIPATTVATEYRRQADAAAATGNRSGAETLRRMADEAAPVG